MSGYGYGLWGLAGVDSLLVVIFAVSFFHPQGRRDWRTLGGFAAFIVALFSEMYGYPLTIYLLSGTLGARLGLSHSSGHLWNDLIGGQGDPHLSPFHLASYALIIAGFWLVAAAWRVLYAAQRSGELATSGAYARVRHPQYVGLLLIMVGFLVQWPTIPTLVMFPVLAMTYRRLAIREEREARQRFGERWDAYASHMPRMLPRTRRAPRTETPPAAANARPSAEGSGGPRGSEA
jgi:protein-S-isoprenylcysteine O-methyltransferase Ste14